MSLYAVFNLTNGELLKWGQCQLELLAMQASEGQIAVELTSEQFETIATTYYYGVQITSRPSMSIVQSGLSFSNIPTDFPIVLAIDNVEYEVTESNVDLTIDTPGTYTVVFKGFPYLNQNFKVVI